MSRFTKKLRETPPAEPASEKNIPNAFEEIA